MINWHQSKNYNEFLIITVDKNYNYNSFKNWKKIYKGYQSFKIITVGKNYNRFKNWKKLWQIFILFYNSGKSVKRFEIFPIFYRTKIIMYKISQHCIGDEISWRENLILKARSNFPSPKKECQTFQKTVETWNKSTKY